METSFSRCFYGYHPSSVAKALAQMEAEHAEELARLNDEFSRVAGAVAELQAKLDDLEAAAGTIEARLQEEMLVVLQSQEKGQLILQEATRRRVEQQEKLLSQLASRDLTLNQIQQLRDSFSSSLRELVQKYRSALSDDSLAATLSPPKTAGDRA